MPWPVDLELHAQLWALHDELCATRSKFCLDMVRFEQRILKSLGEIVVAREYVPFDWLERIRYNYVKGSPPTMRALELSWLASAPQHVLAAEAIVRECIPLPILSWRIAPAGTLLNVHGRAPNLSKYCKRWARMEDFARTQWAIYFEDATYTRSCTCCLLPKAVDDADTFEPKSVWCALEPRLESLFELGVTPWLVATPILGIVLTIPDPIAHPDPSVYLLRNTEWD